MPNIIVLSVLCIVAVSYLGEAGAKKIPRWWLKVAQRQGPNACVVEAVPGTNREFWTECRYWLNREICGVKTQVRFECCEGFEQIDGEDGCTLVKPLKNILDTAESLGATKWAQYIRESGLRNELESAGAFTLFAPTDEAFDAVTRSLGSQLESYRGNPSNPILLYHIVTSKLRSQDFEGDQLVETRHQGHNIRVNKYSNGMTTINCALLLRKDQEATNGIVHIIDGVLDPSVEMTNNVADMVLNDGRFQVMALMLEKSGYINVLRTLQDSISILAPSDEAFQKLPDSRREKIINDREARLAILQNHVIPHVICESAITGEHRVRTMSNNKLTFNCGPSGVFVEKTKMRGDFTLGKNGIIHMIDDVLLPDRAKNLVELAESRQLETFVDFVKRSGLEETLSHTGDYTFFVPEETAWMEMPPEALAQSRQDPEYAGLMLRYHGAYGRHLTNAITDNQAIMSLDEENPVRLQVWRRALGVENAKIIEADIEAQNGVIHIINKVIFPSNKSVEDTLNAIRQHSFYKFLDVLNSVTSEPSPVISMRPEDDFFYTFFVPTDEAFSEVNQAVVDSILADKNKVTQLVTNHVALNMFPEISFEPGLIYSVESIGGKNFNITKSPSGELTVNGANVLISHMSANGVIHVIDDVFLPDDAITYSTVRKTFSSTTSRGGQTSHTYSTKTRHRKVTFTEGHDGEYEDILPAYPKGSVVAGSEKRETSFAVPQNASKVAINTEDSIKEKKEEEGEEEEKLLEKEELPFITIYEASSTSTLHDNATRRTVITPNSLHVRYSTLNNTDVLRVRQPSKAKSLHDSSTTGFSSVGHKYVSSTGRRPLITGAPSSYVDGQRSTVHDNAANSAFDSKSYKIPSEVSSASASSFQTYNNWDRYSEDSHSDSASTSALSHNSSNSSFLSLPNQSLPVGSRSQLTTFPRQKNLVGRDHNVITNKSSSITRKVNTVGPIFPGEEKFTYIGHPYGHDVVGHESSPLPFSSPGTSFIARNSSAVATIAESPFEQAYAFTGDDQEFADGAEFAEVHLPSEGVIEAEQAKTLRRQWRRKRHQQQKRLRNKKGRRRGRKQLQRRNRMQKKHE